MRLRSWDALPDTEVADGELGAEFLARGVTRYRDAGRHLWSLPYGRTRPREDWRWVLREGRGTCSTKHALLAALASEQGLDVRLVLGIYEMHERNTPGVAPVLARHGLDFIPEAHCYLRFGADRIDVTRSGVEPAEPIESFLIEETIVPDQIGAHKVERHRGFLADWLRADGPGNRFTLDALWRIREDCIAALSL